MIVSMPRSDSGTPRPKKNFVSFLCPLQPAIMTVPPSKIMPDRSYGLCLLLRGWVDTPFNKKWVICTKWYICGLVVRGRSVKAVGKGRGSWGRSPQTPFLVCLLYVVYNVLSFPLTLVVSLEGPPTRFNDDYSWRGPPDLADPPLFLFQNSFMGCPCAFPACHVAAPDWATWQPLIGPCFPLPSQHAIVISTWTVWTATWHDPIGPQIGPKSQ
jgi:hypothetical protein